MREIEVSEKRYEKLRRRVLECYRERGSAYPSDIATEEDIPVLLVLSATSDLMDEDRLKKAG